MYLIRDLHFCQSVREILQVLGVDLHSVPPMCTLGASATTTYVYYYATFTILVVRHVALHILCLHRRIGSRSFRSEPQVFRPLPMSNLNQI